MSLQEQPLSPELLRKPMDDRMAAAVGLTCHLEAQDIEPLDQRVAKVVDALRLDQARTFAGCIAYIEEVCTEQADDIDWTISTLTEDHLGVKLQRQDLPEGDADNKSLPRTIWTATDKQSGHDVVMAKKEGLIAYHDGTIREGIIYSLLAQKVE